MFSDTIDKRIRLSVIVPVYNAAPYVERCIKCIENQDIPRNVFEIICINDGSTDNSREILISLQKEFENLILIDKENQGVSKARNYGIDRANGKYLMFIDSDDYVVEDSFESILQNADNHKAQVSFLGYTSVKEGSKIKERLPAGEQLLHIYPGTEAYFLSRGAKHTDPDRIWAILFELDFLNRNNLRFLPNVPYLEDGEFIARILCLAERCIFNNFPFYQHILRTGSATSSNLFHSEKATNGFLLAAINLKRFQKERNLNLVQRDFLNTPVCKFVILVISSTQKPFSLKRINAARIRLAQIGLNKLDLASVNKEYAWLGYFYNSSIYMLIIFQFLINYMRSIRSRFHKITDLQQP
jgi:glycosyltransferase involved in cell wall biosynthesis